MVNPFDLIPKNIKITSTTYDSISICWDKVDCDCYYEVELESQKIQKIYQTQKTEYTLSWLNSGTEYKIRVRTVVLEKYAKSIWSDPITVWTNYKSSNKYDGVWKKCPDDVYEQSKYSVDEKNPRIATNNSCDCTIIGNTSLPLNQVTSWNIKILKSRGNGGYGIYIGVAPFDINQNEFNNHNKYGWYFDCYLSALFSGPPHNYKWPEKKYGEYVRTGSSIGVVMDTTKGDLSFVVNGINYGFAYEGIPLDKPLVPCVILRERGDSVELIL